MDNDFMDEKFTDPDFDSRLYASKVFGANKVAEVLSLINDKLRDLDASIYREVADHHTELFKRVSGVDNLHLILHSMEEKIQNLSLSISRIKKKIDSPYSTLVTNVAQFKHLQITCAILRNISRIATLMKRIHSRSADLAKASLYVNELEYLFSSMKWESIHVLESYHRSLVQTREDMISQAWELVNSSFELADQVQMALGLQVFHNLGSLPSAIDQLVTRWKSDFDKVVSVAVDTDSLTQRIRNRQPNAFSSTGPGRASLNVGSGQAAAFHVAVWTSLDNMVDKLDHMLANCRLLHLTLFKQRDNTLEDISQSSQIYRLDSGPESDSPSLAELLIHELISNWCDSSRTGEFESVLLILASADLSPHLRLTGDGPNKSSDNPDLSIEQKRIHDNRSALRSALLSNEGFLGWASDRLSKRLCSASNQSPTIKEVLEGEYPKLLKLILDLSRRLGHAQPGSIKSPNSEFEDQRSSVMSSTTILPPCLVKALAPFETAYLSRSLSRLFDRVGLAFSTSSRMVPDANDLDDIVQTAANELAFATVHFDLLHKVSRNLDKLISLFANKVESLIAVGSQASQLLSKPNTAQQNNIRLINLLCLFGTQLNLAAHRRLRNLNSASNDPVGSSPVKSILDQINRSSRSHLNTMCQTILDPIVTSIGQSICQVIERIHKEDFNQLADPNTSGSQTEKSKYISELQDLVNRIRQNFLSELTPVAKGGLPTFPTSRSNFMDQSDLTPGNCYSCGEIAFQHCIQSILDQCINTFVLHTTLVRPISNQGRLRLASECVEFELALTPLSAPNIGLSLAKLAPQAHQCLRALPTILTMDTEMLVETFIHPEEQTLESDQSPLACRIPPSFVCQHLFSRAPEEIRSPYEAVKWTGNRFISWALDVSEDERLVFLRNGLSVYNREVQARQQREYPPIYLHLKEFIQHFLKTNESAESTASQSNNSVNGSSRNQVANLDK